MRLPLQLLLLPSLAGLAALAGCAHGPLPADGGAREVRLEPYAGRLRTVSVAVAGEERRFLLDTGGGITLLAPSAAREAGCTPRGRLTGFRMGGERVDFPVCGTVALALGGARLAPEAAVLDLAGILTPGLPPLAGLVSLQTFGSRAVTLDLGGGRLWIETAASLADRTRGMAPLVARPQLEMGGAGLDLFVAVDGRRGRLWFLVDSGNLDEVLLAPHALEELAAGEALEALRAGRTVEVELPVAGLGRARVAARQRDVIYDGVLNAAFLERVVLALDLGPVRAWARWR